MPPRVCLLLGWDGIKPYIQRGGPGPRPGVRGGADPAPAALLHHVPGGGQGQDGGQVAAGVTLGSLDVPG